MCLICEIKAAFVEDPNNPDATEIDAAYVVKRIELLARTAMALTTALQKVADGKMHTEPQGWLREILIAGNALFSDQPEAEQFRENMMTSIENELRQAAGMEPVEELQPPPGFPREVWARMPEDLRRTIADVSKKAEVTVYVVNNGAPPTKH